MAIKRIANCLQLEQGGHFFILYGPGIEDTLISQNHQDLTIEQALWEHLQDLGFERIVFYAPHRQIYFFDRSRTTFPALGFDRASSRPRSG